jgi:hypothetical protein
MRLPSSSSSLSGWLFFFCSAQTAASNCHSCKVPTKRTTSAASFSSPPQKTLRDAHTFSHWSSGKGGFAVFAVFTGNYQRGVAPSPQESWAPVAERTKEQRDNGLFGRSRPMVNINAGIPRCWWGAPTSETQTGWIGRLLKSHINLNLSIGDVC